MGRQSSVLLLHYSCPPVVGGVEEIVRQHAILLDRHGHSVKVAAGSGSSFHDKIPVIIHPLLGSREPAIEAIGKDPASSTTPLEEYTGEIEKILSDLVADTDIVLAHNVLTMPYNLPLMHALHRMADKGPHTTVCWAHDSPYFYENHDEEYHTDPWEILRTFNPSIEYVTISHSRRKQFSKILGEETRIRVIPNGIDPVTFFNLDVRVGKLLVDIGLFESDLVIAQPSRLHPRKNIEFSIRVIHSLVNKGIRAKLLLSGSYDPHEPWTSEYYAQLKGLSRELDIEKEIIILADLDKGGGHSTWNIHDLYLISDVMLLPSLQEGFGIPLLEAGMFKLPIVCSDIEPFREIGGDQVSSFSFSQSPDEVGGMIMNVVNDSPSQRMYRHVIRNYMWDNIYTAKILPLFEEIEGKG